MACIIVTLKFHKYIIINFSLSNRPSVDASKTHVNATTWADECFSLLELQVARIFRCKDDKSKQMWTRRFLFPAHLLCFHKSNLFSAWARTGLRWPGPIKVHILSEGQRLVRQQFRHEAKETSSWRMAGMKHGNYIREQQQRAPL